MLRSETAAQPERMAAALKGLRAYQQAERTPPPGLMPVVDEAHGAMLRDYGGTGAPVLFVPSLINPPNILDLDEEKSLLRWLSAQGHRVLLLDWGVDSESRRSMNVADHVERILVPLAERLEQPPALVGYCLGGTMAIAAAALTRVRVLATIAAPWHFSGFPPEAREMLQSLWQAAGPAAAAMGVLPMEVLQSAFWSLDPGRTVSKFEAFAQMGPDSPEARSFVTLEDWANEGPPVSEGAARELFESFFRDDLPGTGRWRVGGRVVRPEDDGHRTFHIVSATDRIVPHQSAVRAGEQLKLAQGHVGMVIGSRARELLWKPLDTWLRPRP